MIEMIGTVAFACSGAMVAARKKMDVFGVIVLGVTTAVGGGMIRDLILGVNPPTMFVDSRYVCVAVLTAILVFILFYHVKDTVERYSKKIDIWLNIFDAIGVGVFVVAGVNTAANSGYEHMAFRSIFVGVLSGIGGGVLRDIFAGRVPVVLHKRVYAVAALLGSMSYYFARDYMPNNIAMGIGIASTLILRMLATYFQWNLPKIK